MIGEEFYAASAYLSGSPEMLGSIKGQDYVKVGCMIAILFVFISSMLNGYGFIDFDIETLFRTNVIK